MTKVKVFVHAHTPMRTQTPGLWHISSPYICPGLLKICCPREYIQSGFRILLQLGVTYYHIKYCSDTVSPDSLETFQDSCKCNFQCLQMISFEFLRATSIGWTVSRGKHFVHMTRPGARDWPEASFPQPIFHTMTFTTYNTTH